MKTLKERIDLKSNPFEHYAAETEPDISEYAVRPPYLTTIAERSRALGSFILFGDRGSGKSATRITVFNDLWETAAKSNNGSRHPLTVNVTDFSTILSSFQKGTLDDRKITSLVAFFVIEQALLWISSLPEEEREIFTEALDNDERARAVALIEAFYSTVPEMDRKMSSGEAFRLLNTAWTTKSSAWLSRRWDAVSKITGNVLSVLATRKIGDGIDVSPAIEDFLKSFKSDSSNVSRAILSALVDFAQSLGFSGVCVLLDKLDETPFTTSSAESTAGLIHPILAHIQLLEVPGFSWSFFLWSNVQLHFQAEKFAVRLDKIQHANITWDDAGLKNMLESRVRFFSNGNLGLPDLFDQSVYSEEIIGDLIRLTLRSPRELIRVLDMIMREHDSKGEGGLINAEDIIGACDKYCIETIGTWYKKKSLQQILRLGLPSLVNRDVQSKFRIGDQGARNKIKVWEEEGLVHQDGTLPSELGGKPVNRYVVSDPRIVRIIERRLDDVVGAEVEED